MGDEDAKAMLARIDERTKFIQADVAAIKEEHTKRLDEHARELKSLNRFKYYIHGVWATIAAAIGYLK